MSNSRGFTIAELLVAIGVLTLVLSTVYSVFRVGLNAGSRRSAEINMSARETLELLGRELRSACFRPDNEAFEFVGEDVSRGGVANDRISFCTIHGSYRGEKGRFPEPVRVEYFLSAHPATGETGLYRTVRKVSDIRGVVHGREPVAPYVKELNVQYGSGGEWIDRWDRKEALPERVRIGIGLGEDGGPGGRAWFEMETALPVAAMVRQ
ncbi:MAG: prepilin-type N-terminal cleavage/methylation domain-containing protein [bacterium]